MNSATKPLSKKATVSAGPASPAAKPVRANTPAPIIAPTPMNVISNRLMSLDSSVSTSPDDSAETDVSVPAVLSVIL
ncbi:hypothetical protein ACFQL1_25435 [Halomicroarcula sp. GCM10025709]|uniref:hypothetical protein n=1 Tax=Halomicroarcula sp. GCM10025709 TaxID=3252669 RepID=UPI00360AFA3B